MTPDEKRLQRIARMEEKAAKALEKKPRRPAGEPPPKKQKKPSPPKPSKIKALANFFTPKKEEEVAVDRPATAESSKRVSFTPDTKTRESSRAPSRAEKKVVPPGSNTQGGSWKFSDVPTIEHKQVSPSPEKPMPRIIAGRGVRCRTINYDEVRCIQEALDQRRNLSVRSSQNRIIRDHDPRWREKRLTVAKPPPVTNNDFTEALRFARCPFAFLASRRWRGLQRVADGAYRWPPCRRASHHTGKEVVRTRMEQLQASRTRRTRPNRRRNRCPNKCEKKEEEGAAADQAATGDQRCAACRCEARGLFAASFLFMRCPVRRRRHDDAGMEPTYAHTCVKGIKLAAGELSDSTEEEEVEAMEMYARLAEAEDPRDFEQTLQEARKRALAEENEIQQSIETLEELAREHVNDSLAVMEYRYELRQMSKFGFLSGLISAPRAHVERNVAKAVLQGSPKNLRTAPMVLSTFPPVRYSVSP